MLGSGNLGLIYFTAHHERMSLEQITQAFPRLLPGLTAHPGIGFVLAHSEQHGPLAVGAHGGLGGDQARPFVLFPADWPLERHEIVGAGALHEVLQGWLAHVAAEPDAPPERAVAGQEIGKQLPAPVVGEGSG